VLLGTDPYSSAYHVGEVVGLVFGLVLAAAIVWRALTKGFARFGPNGNRTIALLAGLLFVAYVVSGVHHHQGSAHAAAGGWSSPRGTSMKAGFIAGCSHGQEPQMSICECVFTNVTASPRYDTPDGFEGMLPSLRQFARTHDRSSVPGALLRAVRVCRGRS